ncbi:MAG: hypothetical protein DRR19_30760 [Candidatus Parabeggiatoa sp. nov. 1]|nr:MAG: hypothetical protein DRR19_30760 [Gammaproteobacteria bacterium]
MRKAVTKEAVDAAIKQIKKNGELVTIERIRAITGGSPKTISNIRNAINGDTIGDSTLPLFGNVATTGLSYHNVEKRMETIITKRVNNIVTQQLNTILLRLEGVEEAKENPPLQNQSDDIEALGEMRELWLDAYDLFSVAEQELDTAQERIAELENEDSDHTETGRRVFKDELARAVHYLVMTVEMSQTEVATLLKLSNSEVSKLKIKGTKLHQKKK